MPSIEIAPVGALVTADSTAAGVITIVSTTAWYPGQIAWISNNAAAAKRIQIVEILSATTMTARILPDSGSNVITMSYGKSTLATFTLATVSRVDAERQTVPVDQPTFTKLVSIP